MRHATLKIAVGLAVAGSLVGAKTVAATTPGGSFGQARPGGIEVNLGGGSMQQVACAPGAALGASCYVAR